MSKKILTIIGTYTRPIKFGTGQILEGKGEGIYLYDLDLETGLLTHLHTITDAVNPSYLVLNQANGCLYAVNELKEFEGKASGSVSAYQFSERNNYLRFLNKQPTGGTDPCYVDVGPDGAHLYVSNFMSGSVSVFPIAPDGSIGVMSQHIQHQGASVNPARQSGPHAHSLVFSPDGRYAFVPDLGLDKLMTYRVGDGGRLQEHAPAPYVKTLPGAGPRHCAFGARGDFCYLINELDSTIIALAYDQENGCFTELQSVSSLPENASATNNSCADIHITPDGRYLYGSNRGHNSLIIYKIDQATDRLEFVDCQPSGGKIPRNFEIDPTGRFLLCANQDSHNIVVFKINPDTGLLTEQTAITVNTPVCIKTYIV